MSSQLNQPQMTSQLNQSHQSQMTSQLNKPQMSSQMSSQLNRPQQPQMSSKLEIKMDGPTGVEDVLNSLTKGTNRDLSGGEKKIIDLDNDNNLSELGILNNKRKTKNF